MTSPRRRSCVLKIFAESETYFTWLANPSVFKPSFCFSSVVIGRSSKSRRGSTLDCRKRRSVHHHLGGSATVRSTGCPPRSTVIFRLLALRSTLSYRYCTSPKVHTGTPFHPE